MKSYTIVCYTRDSKCKGLSHSCGSDNNAEEAMNFYASYSSNQSLPK